MDSSGPKAIRRQRSSSTAKCLSKRAAAGSNQVLRQDNEWRVVIEVKTRGYAGEDLEKHAGYELIPGRKIFLAFEDSKETGAFEFVSWERLCLDLRRVRPVSPLTASALYMAPIGALEQNLLGLGGPTPHTFDYLTTYLEESREARR